MLQRKQREFLIVSILFAFNMNILHHNGVFIKTKKLTFVHCSQLNCRLSLDFTSLYFFCTRIQFMVPHCI